MKSILECVVLKFPQQAPWVESWLKSNHDERLHLTRRRVPTHLNQQETDALAWDLLRYDVVIIAACPASLGECRILMNQLRNTRIADKPVFAVGHQTQAVAFYDLVKMGIRDFISLPCCHKELRVRLLNARLHASLKGNSASARYDAQAVSTRRLACQEASPAASELEHIEYFHQNDAAQWLRSSYQQAKAVVVGQFERHYIKEALRRSRGNITVAARHANKHRRAFWALMQKHRIKADEFREV